MEFLTDPMYSYFPVSHGHEKPVADTTVVDGKFIFKGVADEPLWLYG